MKLPFSLAATSASAVSFASRQQRRLFGGSAPYREARWVKRVRIATCGALFEAWRRQKKHWAVPKGELAFDVEYLDTGKGDSEKPLVVALHGSPGSYEDYEDLACRLHNEGARFVAPLFPGGETIRYGRFRHTPEEKSEYVSDFLRAIGINRVDMLVCHSAATYPGIQLCLNEERTPVGSLCLLNPGGFVYSKVMTPLRSRALLAKLYEFPVASRAAEWCVKLLMVLNNVTSGTERDHILSMTVMANSQLPERLPEFEELLAKERFPILMMTSENDPIVDAPIAYRMARMVTHESHFLRYDGNGKLRGTAGEANERRQVLVFENGTHFVFRKYPEIVKEKVSRFLWRHFRPAGQ